MNLFLHTGLLMRSEDPSQLIGVMAHEVGHIAGGHLSRVGPAQRKAAAEMILATVLGAATARDRRAGARHRDLRRRLDASPRKA